MSNNEVFYVRYNHKEKIAVLVIGEWEMLVDYHLAHTITADDAVVKAIMEYEKEGVS